MELPFIEPDSFDVVVLGSSLGNVAIAAALAKSKRRVLILEGQDCYGGESSSFTMHCLREAARGVLPLSLTAHKGDSDEMKAQSQCDQAMDSDNVGRKLVPITPFSFPIDRVTHQPGLVEPSASRAYVLDLQPKALYQGEALVDALVASRAHHYIEFKRLEGQYMARANDQGKMTFLPIPASKSDVFRDKTLSIAEKRSLMTFLTLALEAARGEGRLVEALSDQGATSLCEAMQSEGLSQRLQDLILHGIIMSDHKSIKASSGARVLQLLVQSMSRFGGAESSSSSLASAFMVPSWGCGSISEAFVRCCAVSGGTTVLRCPVSSISLVRGGAEEGSEGPSEGWKVEGVVTSRGQLVKCNHLVTDPGTARLLTTPSSQPASSKSHYCYRALIVADKSLVEGQSSLSFVMLGQKANAIRGLQMSSAMGVCPSGQFLLYLSTPCDSEEGGDESYGGLVEAAHSLMGQSEEKPRSIETFFYRQSLDAEIDHAEGGLLPRNLIAISANDADPGFEYSHDSRSGAMGLMGHLSTMALAEEAFKSNFPGLDWLTDLVDEESGQQNDEDGDRDEIDDLQNALQSLMPQAIASKES